MTRILKVLICGAFEFLSVEMLPAQGNDLIDVSQLGSRGVVFSDERPGTFAQNRFVGPISAAGDVNGDGLSDFLLLHYDLSADYEPAVFLVYGKSDLPQQITASEMDGFATRLWRSSPRFRPFDTHLALAPAGDEDNDGFDDFFVLRTYGESTGKVGVEGDPIPGVSYLVHGAESLPAEVDLDSPPAGVRITIFTSTKATTTGLCVAVSTGDLNGDGKADFAFSARSSFLESENVDDAPGRVYVLFGGAPFTGLVDVEEAGLARPGVILEGDETASGMGSQIVFAGDVNGDGFEDLLVGAQREVPGRPSWTYLVYGGATFPRILTVDDILFGGHGVRFVGTGAAAFTGDALAAPGDLNGDGLADFVIGARGAASQAGEVYLIYGHRDFDSDIQLADITTSGLGVAFRGEAGDVFGGDFVGLLACCARFHGGWEARHRPGRLRGHVPGHPPDRQGVRDRGGRDRSRPALPWRGGEGHPPRHALHRGGFAHCRRAVRAVARDLCGGRGGRQRRRLRRPPHLGAFRGRVGERRHDGAGLPRLRPRRSGRSLRLERVEPDTTGLGGGGELTLVGAGLDESVEVRIGGALAPIARAITSARLVVTAPPLARIGLMDVVATRGAQTVTLRSRTS
jgi:hypothetical protein